MKAIARTLAILLIAGLVLPGILMGQAAAKEENKAVKSEVVKLKYKNIQDDIDPTFDFLSDIGEKIDNARHAKDGNGLVASALVLLYAEKAAGKKSTFITGEALVTETGDLAKEQKNAKLARTVAEVYGDAMLGVVDKKKADEFTKLAKEYDAVAAGTRGYCWIRVNNYSSWTVDVYVDGWYKGTLSPGYYAYYKVWEGYTKIYGEGSYTDYYWGPIFRDIAEGETFEWNLWD
jgi:hypothetical protein